MRNFSIISYFVVENHRNLPVVHIEIGNINTFTIKLYHWTFKRYYEWGKFFPKNRKEWRKFEFEEILQFLTFLLSNRSLKWITNEKLQKIKVENFLPNFWGSGWGWIFSINQCPTLLSKYPFNFLFSIFINFIISLSSTDKFILIDWKLTIGILCDLCIVNFA